MSNFAKRTKRASEEIDYDNNALFNHNKAIIKDLQDQRDQLARKYERIRLLKKALTRMVAEFDTTTPVIPNQKLAVKYAINLLNGNDE